MSTVNPATDYSANYREPTIKTLLTMYSKRSAINGEAYEELNQIIHRVSLAVAIAELKYQLAVSKIVDLTLEEATNHPTVQKWKKVFEDHIGKQKFWPNTPANINGDPETSLKVLKYWANGAMAGLDDDVIWGLSGTIHDKFPNEEIIGLHQDSIGYVQNMQKLAKELHGKGCLAACGVAYIEDSLEGIQEAARMEAIATKASMGMGLNTSPLRPWSSTTANGASASGPDRFYAEAISGAVKAVAQGGRRGGALIELRNSDHPDILFFIDKKRIGPEPFFANVYKEVQTTNPKASKSELLAITEVVFKERIAVWSRQQTYLKNTNVTVLAMPGFMQAVTSKSFIRCTFEDNPWRGAVYDPRRPVIDPETKEQVVNELTSEKIFEEYSIDLKEYPGALDAARRYSSKHHVELLVDNNRVKLRGCLYAPEVMDRIVQGMKDSGEPGLMFYETVNTSNANRHVYNLNTCNPCGEQCLPAGKGFDGKMYMGTCNLSSMHAAHADFWKEDGSYDFEALMEATIVQQRFMDNVTDVSWYPLSAQNWTARAERRNGGGFAGIAEFLSRRKLRFGSEEANQAVADLFESYSRASVIASTGLATERGAYPLWEGSTWEFSGRKVRNTCMVNNAPTGTLAQAMQTSWGIEPHVGIVFGRQVRTEWVQFTAPGFQEAMEKAGAWPTTEEGVNELKQKIREHGKSVQGLDAVPHQIQQWFPIKKEITAQQYVEHLAAIYRGCNWCPESINAISNTCNITKDFTSEEIFDSIIYAWNNGIKGITFYPDGSRTSQPCEVLQAEIDGNLDLLDLLGYKSPRTVSINQTSGDTYKVNCASSHGQATLHLTLNHEKTRPGELVEVYARVGKNGDAGPFEAIGRLCSAFLQYAARFGEEERKNAEETIVKQLVDIQSGHAAFHMFEGEEKSECIQSACDGIAKAIMRYRKRYGKQEQAPAAPQAVFKEFEVFGASQQSKSRIGERCRHCSEVLIKVDGCLCCEGCGFSKC